MDLPLRSGGRVPGPEKKSRAGLTMDRNRYGNTPDRPCFLWLGQTYKQSEFDKFRKETAQEAGGVVGEAEEGPEGGKP